MNDNFDRELGQFEQQLKNTAGNLSNIREDLKGLFRQIDESSKETIQELARIEGCLNSHINAEKVQREDLERRLIELKKTADDNSRSIQDDKIARTTFETEVRTGIKAAKVFGAIAMCLATLGGVVASLLALFIK